MLNVYVIDYTTNDKDQLIVFEVQELGVSGICNMYKSRDVQFEVRTNFLEQLEEKFCSNLADRDYRNLSYDLLCEKIYHYNDCLQYHIMREKKYLQRIFFQRNQSTKKYNPDFLVVNRKYNDLFTEEDLLRLKLFFQKYKSCVIIKIGESGGDGNYFFRNKSFQEFYDKCQRLIKENKPFVIESEKSLSSYKAKAKHGQSTTVIKRSLVIVDDGKKIISIDIQKYHVRSDISVDGHNHGNGALFNKKYFIKRDFFHSYKHYLRKKNQNNKKYNFLEKCFGDLYNLINQDLTSIAENELVSSNFLNEVDRQRTNIEINLEIERHKIIHQVKRGQIKNINEEIKEGIYQQNSVAFVLSLSKDGRNLLYYNDFKLLNSINDYTLNNVVKNKFNAPIAYVLLKNDDFLNFYSLSINDSMAVYKITKRINAESLNHILNSGFSVLYLLASKELGRKLIAKNANLRNMIKPKTFNEFVKDKGKSLKNAAIMMLYDKYGLHSLTSDDYKLGKMISYTTLRMLFEGKKSKIQDYLLSNHRDYVWIALRILKIACYNAIYGDYKVLKNRYKILKTIFDLEEVIIVNEILPEYQRLPQSQEIRNLIIRLCSEYLIKDEDLIKYLKNFPIKEIVITLDQNYLLKITNNGESKYVLNQSFIIILNKLVINDQDLRDVFRYTEKELHSEILEKIGWKVSKLLSSALGFIDILQHLKKDLRNELVLDVIFELNNIVIMTEIIQYLSEEQLDMFINNMPDKIQDIHKLSNIIKCISENFSKKIYRKIESLFPKLINSVLDLVLVLSNVKEDLHCNILESVKEKLPMLISDKIDFMNIFNHTKSYSGIAMLQEVVNKLPKRLQDSINIPFEEHGFKDDENDFSKDYLRFALHDELMKAKLELGKAINGNKGISGISRNTVWYGQIKDGDTNLTDRVYQELCEDGSVYTDITMLRLLQMQLDVHAEVINGHEVDLINVVGSEEHFQNALKKLIDFKVNDGFFAINIGYGGFSEKALGQNYWIGGYLMKCTRQYEFYYLDPKISNSCYSDAFQQIKAIVNKKSIMIKNFSVNLQVSSGFKKSFDCGPFVIFMLESLKKISNLPITLALYKNQLMSFIGWLPYNYESSISMGHKLREEYLVLFNALECEKSFESDDGEYSGNVQGGLLKNDIVYNLRLIKNTVHVQDKDSVVFVEERILNQNNVVDVISNWTKSNNEQKHYLSILTVENTEGKKHALALHVENLGGFMKIKIFNSLSLQDSQFQEQVSEIQKLLSAFPAFIYYIDNGSQDPDSGTCCDHSLHQLLDIYTNEIVGVNSNNFLARDEIPMEQYRIPMVPTASLNFAYMMNIKKQAQAEYSEANVIQDELYANIQPIYFVNPSHIFEF